MTEVADLDGKHEARDAVHMGSYKQRLLRGLRDHGWEQILVDPDGIDWWADEVWTLRSVREHHGFNLVLAFLVDPGWEGPRRKGQGLQMICATREIPADLGEAKAGVRVRLDMWRFDEDLPRFLEALDRQRSQANLRGVERLAWDVSVARQRSAAERSRVARYLVDLFEGEIGVELTVGVSEACEEDVLRGCVVQTHPAIEGDPVWIGRLMGNIVGYSEAMAYSVVLFRFIDDHRVASRGPDDDGLRWFSAMWDAEGLRVWDVGSMDDYGEWESIQSPMHAVEEDELSSEILAALARHGVM